MQTAGEPVSSSTLQSSPELSRVELFQCCRSNTRLRESSYDPRALALLESRL